MKYHLIFEINYFHLLNLQAPVAQEISDVVVFRRFQGEGVDFFQIGPNCPPQIFDAELAELAMGQR